MRKLGNYTDTIVKIVKESLAGLSIPSPASGSGAQPTALFNPVPTSYVNVGNTTTSVFVYGFSEYGGEDVLLEPTPVRRNRRYFLDITGDQQNNVI
jgi:hypothetical protein